MYSHQCKIEDLRKAKNLWSFEEDPGLGIHAIGHDFQLKVSDHDFGKGNIRRRFSIEKKDNPGHPLAMGYSWDSFNNNLRKKRLKRKEEETMAKLSIHDNDLRDKIRLKCKNDWDLDLTEDQVSVCIHEMEEQRLSLFHNQIWPNKRNWKKKITDSRTGRVDWVPMERVMWDKTIDGYRAIAHRTGRFAGIDGPVFDVDQAGSLVARITVYAIDKNGSRHPYVGEARFSEFVQLVDEWVNKQRTGNKVPNAQWAEKPHNQLAVAAERQALRKAFQEIVDDQVDVADISTNEEAPEPEMEESRGDDEPLSYEQGSSSVALSESNSKPTIPAPAPTPAPAPAPKSASKSATTPVADRSQDNKKGLYVGLPKGGFVELRKYNKSEIIVMYAKRSNGHYIALDSGDKVVVDDDGYEIERSKRTDNHVGGRKWQKSQPYYDGSVIEKMAQSKTGENVLRLALSSGHEVAVDRWGREIKRKERKNPQPPSQQPQEAHASGEVDVESLDSLEKVRNATVPLLNKWCRDILKKKVAPKEAYNHFTGVVMKTGQELNIDDYKVLHNCLDEALKEDGVRV